MKSFIFLVNSIDQLTMHLSPYFQGMDQTLVEMLKEPIKLPSILKNVDLNANINLVNYEVNSSNELNTISNNQRVLVVPETITKKGDNNATIAIKRLYDSCMREGKYCL